MSHVTMTLLLTASSTVVQASLSGCTDACLPSEPLQRPQWTVTEADNVSKRTLETLQPEWFRKVSSRVSPA